MINYGQNRPDSFYQRKYLGYVKFQGRLIRASINYACFFTAKSIESLPENLKVHFGIKFQILLNF